MSPISTIFVRNSNGTYFADSLKDTNRNDVGFVDCENLRGVEGVGLANTISNVQEVESWRAPEQLRAKIVFDDERSWQPVKALRKTLKARRRSDWTGLQLSTLCPAQVTRF